MKNYEVPEIEVVKFETPNMMLDLGGNESETEFDWGILA